MPDQQSDKSLLLSQELDEIIGRPPHWLIRWGITVFIAILAMVFLMSYFMDYTVKITMDCTINPSDSLVAVTMKESGVITKLIVKDGIRLTKNDTLFYWRSNNDTYNLALSPVTGTAEFIQPVNNLTHVEARQPMMYIQPDVHDFTATVYIKDADYKKLHKGQRVNISLNNYPDQIYGDIDAIVEQIGTVNTARGFYVLLKLPHGLTTNSNKKIIYRSGLSGNATIIISKERLLNKLIKKDFF